MLLPTDSKPWISPNAIIPKHWLVPTHLLLLVSCTNHICGTMSPQILSYEKVLGDISRQNEPKRIKSRYKTRIKKAENAGSASHSFMTFWSGMDWNIEVQRGKLHHPKSHCSRWVRHDISGSGAFHLEVFRQTDWLRLEKNRNSRSSRITSFLGMETLPIY